MTDQELQTAIEMLFVPDDGTGRYQSPAFGYRTADPTKLPAIRDLLLRAVGDGWYGRNGVPIGWRHKPETIRDSDFADKLPWQKCWLRVTYRMDEQND